jgi:predicted N-formylglutamate amidohydrolase
MSAPRIPRENELAASLTDGEDHPFLLVNPSGRSQLFLICEHVSNRLPEALGTLGLTQEQLQMHIAWDIGAEGVARLLSKLLDAPLALQCYSRLAYDCNRQPESPGAMPEMSETTVIPGNKGLTRSEKLQRIRDIYWPFHRGVSDFLDERAAGGQKTAIVTIHSFTRVYRGKERSIELGLLHDRHADMALKLLKAFPNAKAALNEPYGPKDGVMHTTALHAEARGLPSVMIEIRNDLIATTRGQEEWAQRLSVPLSMMAKA